MPTAAERKALVFISALALVGATTRAVATRRIEREMLQSEGIAARSRSSSELDAQIDAVNAAGGKRQSRSAGGSRKPRSAARSSSTDSRSKLKSGKQRDPPEPINVNSASVEELMRLPRVGPALANRIVEYRASHGPFNSADDLRHVRGIGVTTSALLAPVVTFSGGYRPFHSESRWSQRDVPPLEL